MPPEKLNKEPKSGHPGKSKLAVLDKRSHMLQILRTIVRTVGSCSFCTTTGSLATRLILGPGWVNGRHEFAFGRAAGNLGP